MLKPSHQHFSHVPPAFFPMGGTSITSAADQIETLEAEIESATSEAARATAAMGLDLSDPPVDPADLHGIFQRIFGVEATRVGIHDL